MKRLLIIRIFYVILWNHKPTVKKKQWTSLMHKTRKEEWEMLKTQIRAQEDTFKKLCVGVHAKQLKDLEANFLKLVHFCKAM